jgi:hypothetical protein
MRHAEVSTLPPLQGECSLDNVSYATYLSLRERHRTDS